MKKFLKITILLILFLFIIHNSIYAINMNLSNNTISNTNNELIDDEDYDEYDDYEDYDDYDDYDYEDYDDYDDYEELYTSSARTTSTSSGNIGQTTNVVTTYQESSFGLSEYLNIAIIVIGILIILLAIAILIRLKN